ncbi:MAG TPA: pilus assembly protein PilM [Candidatus Limnocylindria bacterium]|nr:pilus assembly protein PilM [Candidatus Limnocylindria bacterium]
MTPVCAIELDVRELKVLQLGDGGALHHAHSLLPDGAYREGMPTRILMEVLLQTLASSGVTARLARVAISDAGVAVRDFRMARIPEADLQSAVMYEAKRLIPMDPGDVYYAWHAAPAGGQLAVYLAAARRDMIDGLVAAVAAAGLQVERVDLRALALARAIGVPDGLILDWGHGEATLVLQVDGRPRFFRTVQLEASPVDSLATHLEELSLSVEALLKFSRSADPQLPVGPTTPLYLTGLFGMVPEAIEAGRTGFAYEVRKPQVVGEWPPDFSWHLHVAGIGLLQPATWRTRLTPMASEGQRRAAA